MQKDRHVKIFKQVLLFLSVSLLLSCSNTGKIEDLSGDMFKGLKFRPIGPGTYAGRVSEILVHPGDDGKLYIFMSEDYGASWSDISNNLPFPSRLLSGAWPSTRLIPTSFLQEHITHFI